MTNVETSERFSVGGPPDEEVRVEIRVVPGLHHVRPLSEEMVSVRVPVPVEAGPVLIRRDLLPPEVEPVVGAPGRDVLVVASDEDEERPPLRVGVAQEEPDALGLVVSGGIVRGDPVDGADDGGNALRRLPVHERLEAGLQRVRRDDDHVDGAPLDARKIARGESALARLRRRLDARHRGKVFGVRDQRRQGPKEGALGRRVLAQPHEGLDVPRRSENDVDVHGARHHQVAVVGLADREDRDGVEAMAGHRSSAQRDRELIQPGVVTDGGLGVRPAHVVEVLADERRSGHANPARHSNLLERDGSNLRHLVTRRQIKLAHGHWKRWLTVTARGRQASHRDLVADRGLGDPNVGGLELDPQANVRCVRRNGERESGHGKQGGNKKCAKVAKGEQNVPNAGRHRTHLVGKGGRDPNARSRKQEPGERTFGAVPRNELFPQILSISGSPGQRGPLRNGDSGLGSPRRPDQGPSSAPSAASGSSCQRGTWILGGKVKARVRFSAQSCRL